MSENYDFENSDCDLVTVSIFSDQLKVPFLENENLNLNSNTTRINVGKPNQNASNKHHWLEEETGLKVSQIDKKTFPNSPIFAQLSRNIKLRENCRQSKIKCPLDGLDLGGTAKEFIEIEDDDLLGYLNLLVFENVRAVIKREIYEYLQIKFKYNALEEMKKQINSTLQFFHVDYNSIAIVGSFLDLIKCQIFLSSCVLSAGEFSNSTLKNMKIMDIAKSSSQVENTGKKFGASSVASKSKEKHITSSIAPVPKKNISPIYQYPENFFLKRQMPTTKNITIILSCDKCNFTTNQLCNLQRHQEIHKTVVSNGDQSKKKNYVNLNLNGPNLMIALDENNSSEENTTTKKQSEKRFMKICGVCNEQFTSRSEFKKHFESIHSVHHKCQMCNYTTYKRQLLLRHVKNVHDCKRPFICAICDRGFKRQDALKNHQIIHIKEGKDPMDLNVPLQCQICQKVMRSSSYLREHMLTHSDNRSFLCEICGSSFKTRAVQRNHIRIVHGKTTNHVCSLCHKVFCTKFSLIRHSNKHRSCLNDLKYKPPPSMDPNLIVVPASYVVAKTTEVHYADISSDATYSIPVGEPLEIPSMVDGSQGVATSNT